MSPTNYMVGLSEIIAMMVDEDQRLEGPQEPTCCEFYGNHWIVDNCMWIRYSFLYRSWLDLNTVNKGPLGSTTKFHIL